LAKISVSSAALYASACAAVMVSKIKVVIRLSSLCHTNPRDA
jgi:hypothetical protein